MKSLLMVLAMLGIAAGAAAEEPAASGYRGVLSGTQPPPPGWKLAKTLTATPDQVVAFGSKLGIPLAAVTNSIFTSDEGRFQINLLECLSPEDARKARALLRRMHGDNPVFALADGDYAIELVSEDVRLVRRAQYAFGLRPRTATYRVFFTAAPIDRGDYTAWNNLMNLFIRFDEGAAPGRIRTDIERLAGRFSFGHTVRLRSQGLGPHPNAYAFTPEAASTTPENDLLVVSFDGMNEKAGVPVVEVQATVTAEAFATTPTERTAGRELLATTPFWPVYDADVAALASEIVGDRTAPRDKVAAILEWMVPGRNIRYDGATIGSRNGVAATLKKQFGRCWDFSDLFITLCRAAGVPSRQVAGWLYEQEGHVWAEVLFEGEGWVQVDPTAGAECTTDYIPYLTSEDGWLNLVYASTVRVEP